MTAPFPGSLSVAVLVPCRNEAPTVGRVVAEFLAALPAATVYVFDNGSSDGTADVARKAGAVVRREPRPGKGFVVRRMFADVDADVYVLVDGDGTYDASAVQTMLTMLLEDQLDMVVACREPDPDDPATFREGHRVGNLLFTSLLRRLFGGAFSDVFSGYRVLSRRLVKSFPVTSKGFEIETELTAHALDVHAAAAELPTLYRSRVDGSSSKLRTWRDGTRILIAALIFFKELRPARFFGSIALMLTIIALALGIPVVLEFRNTGLVPRYPTAFLAAAIQVAAIVNLTSGIVLHSVGRGRCEAKMLAYLSVPPVGALDSRRRSESVESEHPSS